MNRQTKQTAITALKEMLLEMPTIYAVSRYRTASGKKAVVSFYYINEQRQPVLLDYLIQAATGLRYDTKYGGVVVWKVVADPAQYVINLLEDLLCVGEQKRLQKVWL